MSNEELLYKKLDILRKLTELSAEGAYISQNYSINSDLKVMEFEYIFHKKRIILNKLNKFPASRFMFSKKYDMNSDLKEMEFEYENIKMTNKFYYDMIKLGIDTLSFLYNNNNNDNNNNDNNNNNK